MEWRISQKKLEEFRQKERISQRILSQVQKEWWQSHLHPRKTTNRKLAACRAHDFATQIRPALKQEAVSAEQAIMRTQKRTGAVRGFLRVLIFLSLLLPTVIMTTWIHETIFAVSSESRMRHTNRVFDQHQEKAPDLLQYISKNSQGINFYPYVFTVYDVLRDIGLFLHIIDDTESTNILLGGYANATPTILRFSIVFIALILAFRNIFLLILMSAIHGIIFLFLFIYSIALSIQDFVHIMRIYFEASILRIYLEYQYLMYGAFRTEHSFKYLNNNNVRFYWNIPKDVRLRSYAAENSIIYDFAFSLDTLIFIVLSLFVLSYIFFCICLIISLIRMLKRDRKLEENLLFRFDEMLSLVYQELLEKMREILASLLAACQRCIESYIYSPQQRWRGCTSAGGIAASSEQHALSLLSLRLSLTDALTGYAMAARPWHWSQLSGRGGRAACASHGLKT